MRRVDARVQGARKLRTNGWAVELGHSPWDCKGERRDSHGQGSPSPRSWLADTLFRSSTCASVI